MSTSLDTFVTFRRYLVKPLSWTRQVYSLAFGSHSSYHRNSRAIGNSPPVTPKPPRAKKRERVPANARYERSAGGPIANLGTSDWHGRDSDGRGGVSVYTIYQLRGLRQIQAETIDHNRTDSLLLLRIQNDLNSVALSIRDMLDAIEPYPLSAWQGQLRRIRQLRTPRLVTSKLLQLALQLRDWLRNWRAFTVHYQPLPATE
jgi:hypothetical protein